MQVLVQYIFGQSVNPVFAYTVSFLFIILAIYILVRIGRKFMGGTYVAGGKARHLRLAIMDATLVDSHRRLVLVRRDDVEHLILIGGPTDIVVEQNIRLSPQSAPRIQPSLQSSPESTDVPIMMTAAPSFEPVQMPKLDTRQPVLTPIPLKPLQPNPMPSPQAIAPTPPKIETPVTPPRAPTISVAPPERVPFQGAPKIDMPSSIPSTLSVAPATPSVVKPTLMANVLVPTPSAEVKQVANFGPKSLSSEDEMESILASLNSKTGSIG